MTSTIKTYRADPELAKLLKGAARGELKLRIDTDGNVYDIQVTDTTAAAKRELSQRQFERREGIWKDYDVERVRAAFESAQGLLEGVDVDELVKQIREDREDDRWDS